MGKKLGNAAIYYESDAFNMARQDLMGRHSAGAGFLTGMARHANLKSLYCFTADGAHFTDFAQRVSAVAGSQREAKWIKPNQLDQLSEVGALFVPEPTLGTYAWQRRFVGARSYSLCGVTHTICSANIMDGLGEVLLAPTQSWDAIICTSYTARDVINTVFDEWSEYLSARLGAAAAHRPKLPIIPLGVDTSAYAASDALEMRNEQRQQLGIGDDDIAVLFLGRLSFHAKAHPLPMFLALEEVARRSKRLVHLILGGYFFNKFIEEQFREGAKRYCPSVPMSVIDARDESLKKGAWQAADIFTSLSDNIQETFGLTLIEAMAAGLPVVASDWNGYRETVVQGETGILVPTVMAPPGTGDALARAFATGQLNYDRYIGHASQCAAVDIRACVEAYSCLIEDKDLRRRMGAAGRERAEQHFDWRLVIRAYQELWGELDERRQKETESAARVPEKPMHRLRGDPFTVFQGYPTQVLGGAQRLYLAIEDAAEALSNVLSMKMNSFGMPLLFSEADCREILHHLQSNGPCSVDQLVALRPENADAIRRACVWLIKTGIVSTLPSE